MSRPTLSSFLVAVALVCATGGAAAVTDGHASATLSAQDDEPAVPGRSAVADALVGATATANGASSPEIVAAYPNPVAHGDPGEFVAIEFPAPTNVSGWTLRDDGRQSAALPDATVEGTVAFSLDPNESARHTDLEVRLLDGHLQLADDGDAVELRRDGDLVDRIAYERAPESEVWRRGGLGGSAPEPEAEGTGRWVPLGATDHEPVRVEDAAATAFVLPDDPETAVDALRAAEERVLLAAYTLTDERVATALREARERGVEVVVTVEGAPVGGTTERQASLLDELDEAGVEVVAFGGDHARYRFHHAKYAVVDDRAIVLTENWKPAGTGGASSRGWGVSVDDAATAEALADVFREDLAWRDAVPWSEYRDDVSPIADDHSTGSYPVHHDPERVSVDTLEVLVAPDNAEAELVRLLTSADESIEIVQVSIGGRDNPLLGAALEAARRGVEVRILLSGAEYAEAENRELAEWLEERAAEEDLDLEVELAAPRSRYEKIHAKGIVVDGETAVVGSINWNANSLRNNREVALVLHGEEVAAYYADVFRSDWPGGTPRYPVGVGATVAVGVAGSIAAARRRIAFA